MAGGIDVHAAGPRRAARAGAERRPAARRASARLARRLGPGADGRPRAGVFGGMELAPGEGLALINSSAFGTGLGRAGAGRRRPAAWTPRTWPRRSAWRASPPTSTCCIAAIERARPDPVLARTLARFRELLEGSYLWEEGAARNLQDPLTYRSTAPIQAAARRARRPRARRSWRSSSTRRRATRWSRWRTGRSSRRAALRGRRALGRARLRPHRAGDDARSGLRAQRQAAGHALVRAARPGCSSQGGPDLGLSILAITAQSLAAEVEHARPAGLVHSSTSTARRGGHRGPCVAPASLRAPAGGAGRRWATGSWPSSCSCPRRPWTCAASIAARARHAAAHERAPAGRADDEGRRHAAGGREPRERAHPRGAIA